MSKKAITSWCLYDWANSAFAATVMAALFPPFFRGLATAAGLSTGTATAAWGYTTSLTAPSNGAISAITSRASDVV
jgi:UMF1 family MFS transporter